MVLCAPALPHVAQVQARAWPAQGWTSTPTPSEGKGRSHPTCEPRLGLGAGQGLLVALAFCPQAPSLMGPQKPQLALSVLSVCPSTPSLPLAHFVSTLLPGPASSDTWASPHGASNRARPLTCHPTELPKCGLSSLLPAQWLFPARPPVPVPTSTTYPGLHHLSTSCLHLRNPVRFYLLHVISPMAQNVLSCLSLLQLTGPHAVRLMLSNVTESQT